MNKYCPLFLSLLICTAFLTKAQCIATYPHTETFEAAPTWTAGGSNSDWAWGTPTKSTINSAGGGLKSWCVAGLAGSAYNNSEQSFIKSPCYNFSALTYPYVSFKIFWESEWLYDGASLQYSTNNGTTWTTVGAFGDPVNCMTQNWYTKTNITYLAWVTPSNKNGWSGNSQSTSGSCQGGNGSAGWVTAKHCLNGLAGQSNVIFRFTFGSGSTCNNFDGFAIDDFTIDNAPANAPALTYTCNSFTAINPPCPTPSTYLWNFGDPLSGTSNTSTLNNPTHNFSSAGIYTVSLTTSGGPCNAPGTTTQTISVIGFSVTSSSNVTCFGGNDGTANVSASFGTPNYTYTWLPTGGNSNSTSTLSVGNYTVLVKDAMGCTKSGTISITQPSSLTIVSTQTNVSCFNGNDGIINASVTGGTGAYTYTWLPNNVNSNTLGSLTLGTYTCLVKDANMCLASKIISVSQPTAPLVVTAFSSSIACGISAGSATINANGGTPLYTYTWLPSGGNMSTASNLSAGSYTCIIADANQCATTTTLSIAQGLQVFATVPNYSACANEHVVITATASGGDGGPYSYLWNLGGVNTSSINVYSSTTLNYSVITTDASGCSSAPAPTQLFIYNTLQARFNPSEYEVFITEPIVLFTDVSEGNPTSWYWSVATLASSTLQNVSYHFPTEGSYQVQLVVTDSKGCKDSISELIKVNAEVTFYVPNSFTPNGDNLNDVFMAQGTGWNESTFQLKIYNRWGELVFNTNDYKNGWDGKLKNKILPNDVYTWKLEVADQKNKLHQHIGHVSLIN